MTYFSDLSVYTYRSHNDNGTPIAVGPILTRNVGWLDAGHEFPRSESVEGLLSCLWPFCMVSVCPARGVHDCPFCGFNGVVDRDGDGERYSLGAAEIRVFDRTGQSAFAAPNLVYHYIEAHHYLPPSEFVDALQSGPQPQTEEYRGLVEKTGAHWIATEPFKGVFRFVKRGDEVVREWVIEPKR
jgi:hypothetical protein